MQDLFITEIHIKKVRHLNNIEIPLSNTEKKHLILTGKNGSGKTSVMEVLKNKIARRAGPGDRDSKIEGIEVNFNRGNYDPYKWEETGNVFVYCPAERKLKFHLPTKIEAVNVTKSIMPSTSASENFIQYMLHLNYQKMSALTSNEPTEAEKIEKWFVRFTEALRTIYNCPELELKHNSKDLSFKIIVPEREPFGLHEMADGYSSLFNIIIELMMRMESQASITYDMPGIALIDEVESHLHVELQKQVLPFLIKMFPNIQFIVTTHSPFVITSISNAVVFDLEKQEAIEDLSAYSYEGIIESYFGTDMYSQKAKEMFEQYKVLIDKINRTIEESRMLTDAIDYLEQIPPYSAKELVYVDF